MGEMRNRCTLLGGIQGYLSVYVCPSSIRSRKDALAWLTIILLEVLVLWAEGEFARELEITGEKNSCLKLCWALENP